MLNSGRHIPPDERSIEHVKFVDGIRVRPAQGVKRIQLTLQILRIGNIVGILSVKTPEPRFTG